jgi:hypothetical protein
LAHRTSDRNADGLLQVLSFQAVAAGQQVSITSGASETRTVLSEQLASGEYRRVMTDVDGLATSTIVDAADSTKTVPCGMTMAKAVAQ